MDRKTPRMVSQSSNARLAAAVKGTMPRAPGTASPVSQAAPQKQRTTSTRFTFATLLEQVP